MVGIGFFAPLPLALMMPFMAGQSMVMGEAFGKSYQYGKRKISAMSNEEFNKLTPQDLAKSLQTDYLTLIPSLKASIAASRDFQSFIIQELAAIVRSLPKDVISGLTGSDSGNLLPLANADTGKITSNQVTQGTQIPDILDAILNWFDKAKVGTSDPLNRPDETDLNQDFLGTFSTSAIDKTKTMMSQWDSQYFTRAYNQRDNITSQYNEHGITETKFRQLLVLEFKKRGGTKIETIEEPPIKDPTPQISLDYFQKKIKLLQNINAARKLLININDNIKNSGLQPHFRPILTQREAAVATAEKALINHITVHRNIGHTKAEANNDWNNRIWKK